MTVSEYIFDFIYKVGCNEVFMVSGSSAMWLTDALCRNDKLKAICTHHEQAAAMAADGYGRVNNIPGTCLVTIGPGATNAITGVAQAFLDSSPMFIISGQANSKLLKYETESGIRQHGTQSLNLEPIVSSITKYFAAVMNPEDIRYHMERAYFESMNGRKGPVWIDVPVDIQNRQLPDEMTGFIANDKINSLFIQDSVIRTVIEKIITSSKPLILAGNGVASSSTLDKMIGFAETFDIPVVTSRGGIGVIPTEHRLFVGRPGSYGDRASHFAIQECDLLLILGSRLSVSTIGYYPKQFGEKAYKIMVDIDRHELAKDDVPVDIKLECDLNLFFDEFNEQMSQNIECIQHEKWIEQCTQWKSKYPVVQSNYKEESPINEYYFTDILSEKVSGDANVIVDTGSVCNIVSQSWKLKKGQKYLISGGLSCMGFWATAIGTVQDSRQIIAITGDGSAQMNIQELATLQYNNMPIKLFIYNNNGYMLIRHNQHNYMDDRFLGVGPDSGLKTPNFCEVARAYGIKSVKIEKSDDIDCLITEVLKFEGPVVCEVVVQEFAPIIPRIASRVMPDGSLKAADFDDLYPFLDENE